MTDSEEEYEVDEFHRVGFAAEVACILAIGCVAGLKGLSKMRKGVGEFASHIKITYTVAKSS